VTKASIKNFIKYWLPVIIYAIIIFYVSSLRGEEIPSLFAYQDVVFHVIEYAVFAILINRALKACYPSLVYIKRIFWVFFVASVYAITDELHQACIPNRCASIKDFAFDVLGVFICNVFYR
jgi:VanZ family protein